MLLHVQDARKRVPPFGSLFQGRSSLQRFKDAQ